MIYNLEINEFLKQFNTNSYNQEQIGADKTTILSIYEFLRKLNISKKLTISLINYIAYYQDTALNIPLFLEILSRSLGFISTYELNEVFKVVKEIHDIYYENAREISLEEYLHDTMETRLKKLFLDRNHKYLVKDFSNTEYINDLKFAGAINLEAKEYKEFLNYIDDFTTYKDGYSPMINFKIYSNLRISLKGLAKLFWDIYYGMEYLVAFNKYNLKITDIYDKSARLEEAPKVLSGKTIQLDLFTYQEYTNEDNEVPEDFKLFQISTLYSKVNLPEVNTEKDLLAYYNNFLNSQELINLPKLKSEPNPSYIFEVN